MPGAPNDRLRKSLRVAALVALVALPVAARLPAAEGWRIDREVVAEAFAAPSLPAAARGCDGDLDRPGTGARVRLLVAAGMARRDEPAVSYIVRLDSRTAYILHHRASTYSELAFPPPAERLMTAFGASLGAEADEYLGFRLESEVREEVRQLGNLAARARAATVANRLGRRLDVRVHLVSNAQLAAAAQAVEGFSQAVRRDGRQWLELLGPGDGVPVMLEEAAHLPSSKVEYAEVLDRLEKEEIGLDRFSPPTAYTRIDHLPSCFAVSYR